MGVYLTSLAVTGLGTAIGSALAPQPTVTPVFGFLAAAVLSLPLNLYQRGRS